jgi:hypothetical protein
VKGPAADATDALQPWGLLCNPVMKVKMRIIFCPFPSNGAPVEWNWQGKTEELGEKPVPVPLRPPQIPHGLTRDWTRASAVGGRRLTAWAMARPSFQAVTWFLKYNSVNLIFHEMITLLWFEMRRHAQWFGYSYAMKCNISVLILEAVRVFVFLYVVTGTGLWLLRLNTEYMHSGIKFTGLQESKWGRL